MIVDTRLAFALASGVCIVAVAGPASAQQATFDIPAGALKTALDLYAEQSGRQVIYRADEVRGVRSAGVRGVRAAEDALTTLLAGTGFVARQDASGALAIVRSGAGEAAAAEPEHLSEILVVGTRSQNADIMRTRDDVQPYVVMTGEEIAKSGAGNLEQFLQRRLPMNAQRTTTSQAVTNAGQISMRGLSAAETLILVDGRRLPSVGISTGSFGQPNINGIPLSSIERIEVLPATAGGIYGGNATGGVINIILKRDAGLTVDVGYGGDTRGDTDATEISMNGGFSLEDGKTRVNFGATWSEQGALSISDRVFQREARERNWLNRPADFTTPIYSSTPNLCAVASAFATTCSATPLTIGGVSLGSAYASLPAGYAGPAGDGVGALFDGAGRPNFQPVPDGKSLYSGQQLESYLGSVRRSFGDRVEAYLDAAWDRTVTKDRSVNQTSVTLAATDPANPFDQAIRVSLPLVDLPITQVREVENRRVGGGVIARLPGGGTVALEKTWSESANTTSTIGSYTAALGSADVLGALRAAALTDVVSRPPDLEQFGLASQTDSNGPARIVQDTTTLRFAQPLMSLPGGDVTASGYLERRIERAPVGHAVYVTPTYAAYTTYAPKRRRVNSAYGELKVPVFSPENGRFLVDTLELFGSIRHDNYRSTRSDGSGSFSSSDPEAAYPEYATVTNTVSATSYTAAAKYAPVRDLAFRVSYGTGFLPPDLSQLTTSSFTTNLSGYVDPKRNNEPLGTAVTLFYGGSPDLDAEKSKSFSAGLVLTPRFLDGFRMSLDYVRLRKTDELGALSIADLLLREDDFPGLVVRGPNGAGDPAGWAGPIVSVSNASFNIARTEIEAWDFQIDYSFGNDALGTFRPYVIGTHQTRLERQVLSTDAPINRVGWASAPLSWKGNFGVDWSKGSLSVSWNAQYFDKYRVCSATLTPSACAPIEERQGSRYIPSQLYNDLVIQFDLGERRGGLTPLSNARISFSAFNVFDREPPIVASTWDAGYDFNGDPRLRRFKVNLSKTF